jgi:hypothetical protein
MRQMMWTLLLMITVGVLAFAAGQNAQTTTGAQVLNAFETGQPHVVLAKSGTHHQKEAREQSEGCQVMPNGEGSQQKNKEQDDHLMKGLVF